MSTLFAHQEEGAERLVALARANNGRSLLADVPGLGKTRTVLRQLQIAGARRPVVICPASVREHWRREAAVMGVDSLSVYSYAAVVRGGATWQEIYQLTDFLILDESHELRNTTSQRTKALLGRESLGRRAVWVTCVTGTPLFKSPLSIWPHMSALWPHRLQPFGIRSLCDWRNTFTRWVAAADGTPKVVDVKRAGELRALLDTFMLRRLEHEIGVDVPAVWWQLREVEGEGESLRRLHALESESALIEAVLAGRTIDEAGKSVAEWRHALGLVKAHALAHALAEEATSEPLVIAAHHRDVLDTLQAALKREGLSVARLDGSTPPAERQARVDAFQQGVADVFLAQNIAAMTGITLTRASRMILVEPDWTGEVNRQLAHRIARIGQERAHCIIQLAVLSDSIERAVAGQHQRELAMSDKVLLDS